MEWINATIRQPDDAYQVFIRTPVAMNVGYFDEGIWYCYVYGNPEPLPTEFVEAGKLIWLDDNADLRNAFKLKHSPKGEGFSPTPQN